MADDQTGDGERHERDPDDEHWEMPANGVLMVGPDGKSYDVTDPVQLQTWKNLKTASGLVHDPHTD